MKNNLFTYATSELSQDAFICWLASFAFQDADGDAALCECAQELLSTFVPEFENSSVQLLKIDRQVGNRNVGYIDVLLTVLYRDKIYKIIVEDKTYSDDHDNQLARYLTNTKTTFPEAEIRGVYYKTGFQSDISKVVEAGYQIISRESILAMMKKYIGKTQNSIFINYYEYWNAFQKEVERYRDISVSMWDWKQINGCYTQLKNSTLFEEIGLSAGFGYVANPTGGFYGLWASIGDEKFRINGADFELYLQLETHEKEEKNAKTTMQLCLKLSADGNAVDSNAIREGRDAIAYVHEGNKWRYVLTNYGFKKPNRIGSGRHMTIGIYDAVLDKHEDVEAACASATEKYKELLNALRATQK